MRILRWKWACGIYFSNGSGLFIEHGLSFEHLLFGLFKSNISDLLLDSIITLHFFNHITFSIIINLIHIFWVAVPIVFFGYSCFLLYFIINNTFWLFFFVLFAIVILTQNRRNGFFKLDISFLYLVRKWRICIITWLGVLSALSWILTRYIICLINFIVFICLFVNTHIILLNSTLVSSIMTIFDRWSWIICFNGHLTNRSSFPDFHITNSFSFSIFIAGTTSLSHLYLID